MPRRKKVENLSLEEMLMKTEQEIKTTEAELKELRLKAKELRKKIEDKQKDEIFSALLASGKTVEEVMTYLKSGNEERLNKIIENAVTGDTKPVAAFL